jgi:c-di-GMP-binding flagellar brake protein YcgR
LNTFDPEFAEKNMSKSPGPSFARSPVKSERRIWKRFPIYTEVWCQPKTKGPEEKLSALILNISRGGLKLVSVHKLETGTLFRIGKANSGDRSTAALSARVVHVAPEKGGMWLMGCAFTPKLDEDRLQEWIKPEKTGNGSGLPGSTNRR